MFGYFYILGTSLVTVWVMGASGAYVSRYPITTSDTGGSPILSPKSDVFQLANGTLTPLGKDFPITEDGRCGVNYGTRCENDECCSAEGYVPTFNTE